jgi:hypothetical protein
MSSADVVKRHHPISRTCDPRWCHLDPLPVSLDWGGTWQVHQHDTDPESDTTTRCGHGGVRVLLDEWALSHILDDTVASQRCDHCWTDETWAAMLRLVDHACRIDTIPAVTT